MMKRRLLFISGAVVVFLLAIDAHRIGAHGIVDQDTLAPSQSDVGFCTSQLPVGQTFVPQATTLVGFDIALNGRLGGGILDVEVRHWPAGPGGPVLSSVRASVVPGPNHVDLPAAVPLTPGTKYVVLVTRAQLAGDPGFICFNASSVNTYAPGCFVHRGAESCAQDQDRPPLDILLRTYAEPLAPPGTGDGGLADPRSRDATDGLMEPVLALALLGTTAVVWRLRRLALP